MRTNRRGFLTGLATLAAAARAKGEALVETKETGKAPEMSFCTGFSQESAVPYELFKVDRKGRVYRNVKT